MKKNIVVNATTDNTPTLAGVNAQVMVIDRPKVEDVNKPAKEKKSKANPTKDARRGMLSQVKEQRQSLGDCLRLIAMFGASWVKLIGLDLKTVKGLTPNDLRPFQLESERYRAAISDAGELSKIEVGWTPTKVANAIERYAVWYAARKVVS